MSDAIRSKTVRRSSHHTTRRRQQEPASPGHSSQQQPARPQGWAGKTPQEILARYQPGKAPPLKVLEILIKLFNTQHTALEKTVSHKTRQERAQFLRRFFRDLKLKAGFKTVPDPRNLGQKHIHAMVQVWQQAHLAPATIQTYLSFLRGLAMWMGKHGFVRKPGHYGLSLEEYQRHESAQRDKSWSAQEIDAEAVIAEVCKFDLRVGASLRLMSAMGLRRKESVQFRPFQHVMPFSETGLPENQQQADRYAWVKGKGGRVRWIPLDSPVHLAALEFAQGVVDSRDAHMGDPRRDLKRNLRRLDKARQARNKRIGQFVRWLCHGLFVRPLHSLQKGLRYGSDIAVECLPEGVKEPAVAQVRRLARETEFTTAHTAFEQQAAQSAPDPLPASTEAQASPSAKTTRSAA